MGNVLICIARVQGRAGAMVDYAELAQIVRYRRKRPRVFNWDRSIDVLRVEEMQPETGGISFLLNNRELRKFLLLD